jgi:hypothetical protein
MTKDFHYITWNSTTSGRLPPFGKTLECVRPDYIENLLVKAINRFST